VADLVSVQDTGKVVLGSGLSVWEKLACLEAGDHGRDVVVLAAFQTDGASVRAESRRE